MEVLGLNPIILLFVYFLFTFYLQFSANCLHLSAVCLPLSAVCLHLSAIGLHFTTVCFEIELFEFWRQNSSVTIGK